MTITLSALQKQRRDTAANWTAENPTLLAGEIGIESDTGYWKVGDGSTAWTSLAYVSGLGGKVGVPDGTAAAPAIYFADDTNTGIYSPGADQLALSTNGTQRISIGSDGDINIDSGGVFYDASTNRLAIGTSSPGHLLDLNGINPSLRLDAVSGTKYGNSFLRFYNNNANLAAIYFGDPQDDNAGEIQYVHVDDSLRFSTNGGERFRCDSSGTFRVKGAGTAGVNDAVQLNGSAPANSLLLDASGRLLVGTSSSSATGTIFAQGSSASATGPSYLYLQRGQAAGASIGAGTSLGVINFGDSASAVFAQIAAEGDAPSGSGDYPGRLVFSTTADGASSPTERMRISQDGFTVVHSESSGRFAVKNAGTNGANAAIYLAKGAATATSNGTTCFVVRQDGDVENTNNSYGALSDIKLKENIVDSNSQWDDLKALQVRNYNFKSQTGYSTHTQIGLIAQEVELVSPGLVSESPDRDEDGNDLGTVTKSVNYSVLYMKAVKALQEAMERIETLEAKVAALETP